MTAKVAVTCKAVAKDLKDGRKEVKELRKDTKELSKDLKDARKEVKELAKERKDAVKETKELRKEAIKETKDGKEAVKDRKDVVEHKGGKEVFDRPGGLGGFGELGGGLSGEAGDGAGGFGANDMLQQQLAMLEARLAALETGQGGQAGAAAQPFIGADLRPDLVGQMHADPASAELQQRMAEGDRDAKVAFDNLPPCNY